MCEARGMVAGRNLSVKNRGNPAESDVAKILANFDAFDPICASTIARRTQQAHNQEHLAASPRCIEAAPPSTRFAALRS